MDILKSLFGKRKKKTKIELVDEKNLEAFLKEVTKSIDTTFAGQESGNLEKILEKEVNQWLKETIFSGKKLNPEALKLGICIGIKESLRKINEAEEQETVRYIS